MSDSPILVCCTQPLSQSTLSSDMTESTKNHKRKRNLRDSPVDQNHDGRAQALKEKLADIKETEVAIE